MNSYGNRQRNPHTSSMHCKDKIPKFRNKYSQKRNIGVSVPISTFMRLWVIYIYPQSVFLFCWRKYVDRSWDYINRSQTHESGNWGWGRAISRKGIHKWDFRCSVYMKCFAWPSAFPVFPTTAAPVIQVRRIHRTTINKENSFLTAVRTGFPCPLSI